jgi:anti-sigma B factor antagonist
VRAIATYFEIHEAEDAEWVRLQLTGELDLGSTPVLKRRLAQLQAENRSVRLDLSRLGFMDSSGVHLLVSALNDAYDDGWRLEVDPHRSAQVERLFRLSGVEGVFAGHAVNGA